MGLSSFSCNDSVHCWSRLAQLSKAIAFPTPRLVPVQVKNFKTDMKSPFHVSFGVFFFLQSYSSKTFQEILQNPQKKAKINKHRGQLTCPRAQPHFQIRLAPKFQDGAGNTELHKQSRSFEETDRSEIERKSTCSIIELLLSEALPGYDLLKMTIVLIRSSGLN